MELPMPRYSKGKSSPISSHEMGEIPAEESLLARADTTLSSLQVHTQRERNREDQYTEQGNPVAVSVAPTILVVVNIGSEAGQG